MIVRSKYLAVPELLAMAGAVAQPYSICIRGCAIASISITSGVSCSSGRIAIGGGSIGNICARSFSCIASKKTSLGLRFQLPSGGILRQKRRKSHIFCMESGAETAECAAAATSGPSAVESSEAKWEDAIKRAKYGKPVIIEPKGKHLASVVWLHGLGDTGHSWASIIKTLPFENIRWIVPTAPVRPVTVNGGYPCTAWFDVGSLSDEGPDDVDGLDTSAAFVASLLSKEPADVKLAVGGFSMGGATTLYTATHSILGKYTDGSPFTKKIDAAVCISGWLPAGKLFAKQVAENPECLKRAAELPIFMGHGKNDFIVFYNFAEQSARALKNSGFTNITFKSYKGLDHSTTPEELDDICDWLKKKLELPQ